MIRPQTGVRNYHADGLGSIRALTNETGEVTDTWQFEAFGTLLAHSGSDLNNFLFCGEAFEPSFHWYFNRARWLNPQSGGFTSTDPFGGVILDPISLQKYSYAKADPINNLDPSGKFTVVQYAVAALTLMGILSTVAQIRASGPFRALSTIRVHIRPIIVNDTWESEAVTRHLLDARTLYQKFGIALIWPPIQRIEYPIQLDAGYTGRAFNGINRQLQDQLGSQAATIAFIGEPFEVDNIVYQGLSHHIDSKPGQYFGAISKSAVDEPIWTQHELAHIIGDLDDLWRFWGNLLARPFPNEDLNEQQLLKLRKHATHLP